MKKSQPHKPDPYEKEKAKAAPWKLVKAQEAEERASDIALTKIRVKRKNGGPAMETIAIANAEKTRRRDRDRERRRQQLTVDIETLIPQPYILPDRTLELLEIISKLALLLRPRERTVLDRMQLGHLTPTQIAHSLGISLTSAKRHLKNLRTRAQKTSLAEDFRRSPPRNAE